jgi:hypothetical protein
MFCPLCLEETSDPDQVYANCPARHGFCKTCLLSHLASGLQTAETCPLCRAFMEPDQLTMLPYGPKNPAEVYHNSVYTEFCRLFINVPKDHPLMTHWVADPGFQKRRAHFDEKFTEIIEQHVDYAQLLQERIGTLQEDMDMKRYKICCLKEENLWYINYLRTKRENERNLRAHLRTAQKEISELNRINDLYKDTFVYLIERLKRQREESPEKSKASKKVKVFEIEEI